MEDVNVIIVCDFAFPVGGAEKVAIESAVGLAEKGINVLYFSAVGPIDERLKRPNIEVICLNQEALIKNKNKLKASVQGLWNFYAEKKFRDILQGFDNSNTVIHLHIWQKALSASIIREAIKNNFKVIFTFHHYFIACPNGGFFNYKKNLICECKPMSLKCLFTNCDKRNYVQKIWRVMRLYIEHKFAYMPTKVYNYICISNLGKKVLEPVLPKNSNFYFIDNPINISKDEIVKVRNNDKLVYVGRLSKEKGVTLLAEVAKKLNSDVIFVGDGECRNDILKIYPKAEITGWVDKTEVVKFLSMARVLIFPTLWYEGMPLSVLECQAKGVPTIMSDTCTASEIIKDGFNGYLFKRGDAADLEDKIKLISKDDIVFDMSKNAYNQFWKSNYSLDNHINKLVLTYRKVLA